MKKTPVLILAAIALMMVPIVIAPGGMSVDLLTPTGGGTIQLEDNFTFTLWPDNRENVSCDIVIDGAIADTEWYFIPITVDPQNLSIGPSQDYFTFPADYNASFNWYMNCSYYVPVAYGGSANSATRQAWLTEEPPSTPTGAVTGAGEQATEYAIVLMAMLLLIGLVMAVVPIAKMGPTMKRIVFGTAGAILIAIILVTIL